MKLNLDVNKEVIRILKDYRMFPLQPRKAKLKFCNTKNEDKRIYPSK